MESLDELQALLIIGDDGFYVFNENLYRALVVGIAVFPLRQFYYAADEGEADTDCAADALHVIPFEGAVVVGIIAPRGAEESTKTTEVVDVLLRDVLVV
jgi:hypothetical protein